MKHSTTVLVDTDAASAFAFLANPRNVPTYDPPVKRVEPQGETVKGSKFDVWFTRKSGLSPGATMEVVEFSPPHLYAFEGRTKGIFVRDTIEVRPAGERAEVTCTLELILPLPLRLLTPLLNPLVQRGVQQIGRNIAKAISAGR